MGGERVREWRVKGRLCSEERRVRGKEEKKRDGRRGQDEKGDGRGRKREREKEKRVKGERWRGGRG